MKRGIFVLMLLSVLLTGCTAFKAIKCGKGTLAGNNVSHSNRHTKRAWKPNIQQVRAIVNESVKRVNVCTRCLRSGKVTRAI